MSLAREASVLMELKKSDLKDFFFSFIYLPVPLYLSC